MLRGEGRGEREGEKHQLVASHMHTDWGVNLQPRHVPDRDLLVYGMMPQPTEPHWPGLKSSSNSLSS